MWIQILPCSYDILVLVPDAVVFPDAQVDSVKTRSQIDRTAGRLAGISIATSISTQEWSWSMLV